MTKFEKAIDFIKSCVIESDYAHKVYLVGGCVRDELMGLPIKDIDLMIDMPEGGIKFAEHMVTMYPSICKNLVLYPRFGTSKFSVIIDNEDVDIECVMPRGETYEGTSRKPVEVKYVSLLEDAKRRDFTVNALYKDIIDGKVIDPLNQGVNDIKDKILRTTSVAVDIFAEDPLRMMRAIRFYCCKDFYISREIADALEYSSRYLQNISIERINDEFSKIICSHRAVKGIYYLMNSGLMEYIIPEFNDIAYYKQYSKYHDKDVMGHTLSVLSNTEPILSHRLAALLHDIAKPLCHQDFYENGVLVKRQFIGHEKASAELAKKILKNLKYSNDIIEEVCFAIQNHMILKPHVDSEMNLKIKSSTCRKIHRTIFKYYDTCLDLIDADNKSHAPEYCLPKQVEQFKETVEALGIKHEKRKLPITGDDVIEYFKIEPGPKVKEHLDRAEILYDNHPDCDKEKMLKMLKY